MEIENIKFKAKRAAFMKGEWVEGELIHNDIKNPKKVHIAYRMKNGFICFTEVDPYTVCQFTDAKDCDGTSIYEHDLLRSEKTGSIYEVVWNQVNSSFSLIDTEYPVLYLTNTMGRMLRNRRLKVVGNIHDEEWQKKKLKLESE